jgi:membrane associated rhomboid family serine protease
MIPLDDSAPRYRFPLVTVSLIVANVLVFFYEMSLPSSGLRQLAFQFGVVPLRTVAAPFDQGVSAADAILPLFTSMFLHGGWMHLLGNMWFLWIFGDNVEDRLGSVRYLMFYLICGLASALVHILFNFRSTVPTVGASGAIAGVLGAYFVLFPGARVLTLVPLFFLWTVRLPAVVMIGYWFVIQLLSGWASLAMSAQGGTAWWAHVGGFVAGLVLIRPMVPGGSRTNT